MEIRKTTYKDLNLTAIERNQLECIITSLNDDSVENLMLILAGESIRREVKRTKRCVKCNRILKDENHPYCDDCLKVIFAEGCPKWVPLTVQNIKADGCKGCKYNNKVTDKCNLAFAEAKK